jgi:hypothetical protein
MIKDEKRDKNQILKSIYILFISRKYNKCIEIISLGINMLYCYLTIKTGIWALR